MVSFFHQLVRRLRRGAGQDSGTPSRAERHRVTPSLERLGDRIVPALAIVPNGTGLDVVGDGADDVATLSTSASGDILLNGVGTGYNVSSITSLRVYGNGGTDVLDLSLLPDLGVPVLIDGGLNSDALLGSQGADVTRGGAGEDWLFAGDGNDDLLGGLNADHRYGEEGNDILRDDNARDYFNGGDGFDALLGEVGDGIDTVDGGGEDIVIGGRTAWDINHDGLREMRSMWRDTSVVYADRIDDLRTASYLDASHVFSDADADTVEGGAGNDWIRAEAADTLPDYVLFVEQLN